ncbi:MAG: hypothetical protein R3321_03615 [Nitrososphaeraceae archaeon]|nr:hypothetical protein [Nitrososphaeraceae archaeon]
MKFKQHELYYGVVNDKRLLTLRYIGRLKENHHLFTSSAEDEFILQWDFIIWDEDTGYYSKVNTGMYDGVLVIYYEQSTAEEHVNYTERIKKLREKANNLTDQELLELFSEDKSNKTKEQYDEAMIFLYGN